MNVEWMQDTCNEGIYWYDRYQDRALWIDSTSSGYIVTESQANEKGLVTIAGPFDTLDAAKAAYLLIGAE